MPIFIAALGWNHRAGLACRRSPAASRWPLHSTSSRRRCLRARLALPAWWLAYLSLLGRPAARTEHDSNGIPLGRLLLWIAGTAALITLARRHRDRRRQLRELSGEPAEASFESLDAHRQPAARGEAARPTRTSPRIVIAALPFLSAVNFVLVLALNLWLAAKTVQISRRLPRPWPYIPAPRCRRGRGGPRSLRRAGELPAGFPGAFGLALSGALLSAFALQGLAFIHDPRRAGPGARSCSSAVYAFTLVVSSIVMPLLAAPRARRRRLSAS